MNSNIMNSVLTTPWKSMDEANSACEIVKLLGYNEPITVTLFGLLIHNEHRNIYLPAWHCANLLPSVLKTMIEEGGI